VRILLLYEENGRIPEFPDVKVWKKPEAVFKIRIRWRFYAFSGKKPFRLPENVI
jgi:hypothetical protein